MKVVKEFSISLVNKPGTWAGVLKSLSKAKIDGVAMTLSDSAELGVLRLVVVQTDLAKKALKHLNVPMTHTDVLQIILNNKSGALADIVEKLSKAHINISYAYCTSDGRGGKTTGILNVENIAKAKKVLGAEKNHRDGTSVRPSRASRKS
jgi:hypothetical protein